jgi:hypothetical protein
MPYDMKNVRLHAVPPHVHLRTVRCSDHGWQSRVSDVPHRDRGGDACLLVRKWGFVFSRQPAKTPKTPLH